MSKTIVFLEDGQEVLSSLKLVYNDASGEPEVTDDYNPYFDLYDAMAIVYEDDVLHEYPVCVSGDMERWYYERPNRSGDARCDNCSKVWDPECVNEIQDILDRVDLTEEEEGMGFNEALAHARVRIPGTAWPIGECPECSALCYPIMVEPETEPVQTEKTIADTWYSDGGETVNGTIDIEYDARMDEDEIEAALRAAVEDYLCNDPLAKEVVAGNCGEFNWGDCIEIPTETWKRHGIYKFDLAMCGRCFINLHHDESLMPEYWSDE